MLKRGMAIVLAMVMLVGIAPIDGTIVQASNNNSVSSTVQEGQNSINSLEVVALPSRIDYYEGYEDFDYKGLRVKAVYKDGTEAYWAYSSGPGEVNTLTGVTYRNVYENSKYVRTDIECEGVKTSFSFNVVENPVSSIEIISGEILDVVDGMQDIDYGNGNYGYDIDVKDMQVKINYNDGSSTIASVPGTVKGYRIELIDNQRENPWNVGTNYCTISYCGKTVDVPVRVVEYPIESITLNKAPTHIYVCGDQAYGWVGLETYYFIPKKLEGIEFTIKYTDGSIKTYHSEDIEEDLQEDFYVDGLKIKIDRIGAKTPGTYRATLQCLNHSIEYDVEMIKSPVESVKLSVVPELFKYDDYFNYYMADFAGALVTINYEDGTQESVNVEDSKLQYKFIPGQLPRLIRSMEVNGYSMLIEEEIGWSDWLGYATYYTVHYMGVTYMYEDFTYENSCKIKNIEVSQLSIEDEKLVLKVTYTDGSVEKVEQTLVWYDYQYQKPNRYAVYAKLKYGIVGVRICEVLDDDKNVVSYEVGVADKETTFIPGIQKNAQWIEDNVGWWYQRADGSYPIYCWEEIDGEWYYFNAAGYRVENQWIGNYYLQDDGVMATNQWIGAYYVGADGAYIARSGWLNVDGNWYYLGNGGVRLTGWKSIGGTWYYFNASGMMSTGWQSIGGTWYYFNDSGAMVTGWQLIGGTWYYFNGSGAMVTGWQAIGGTWYYFSGSGAMVTGWQTIGDTRYYFNANGAMVTGWQKIDAKWYYFFGSGAMVSSRWVGNYYLQEDGSMAVSKWIGQYYVDENGVWQPNA